MNTMHNIGSALGSLEAQMQIIGNQLDALEVRLTKLEQRRANRAGCERPTLEQVKEYCEKCKLQESDAVWFLEKMEASGWRNGGYPVKSWTATINVWRKHVRDDRGIGLFPSQKQSTQGFQRVNSTSAHITAQKELDRVLEAIRRIKAGYDPHQEMSMDDWNKLKPLRERRDQLKEQLGIKV